MADVTTTFAAKDESFAKTVGKLQGRLTEFEGQTHSFSQRVGSLAASFAKFAVPIAGIATAFISARTAAQAFSDAIRIGGELNDLAARTGATAGELAVLQRAFENAGVGAGSVGTVIDKLRRSIMEASQGTKEYSDAFERLGINLEAMKSATPTEQLQMMAKALSRVSSDTERTALAMDLLGRSGGELIPLLRAMGVELDTARTQLGSYPKILDKTNQALDTIGDNFAAISKKVTEFASGLLVNFAPALAAVTTEIANIDAAGLGLMLSDYLKKFLKTTAETYKLREALDSVKIAIQGIVSGNFGDGLSLMWVTMKITALNAINEVVKNFVAGLKTVGQFLATMFASDGALLRLIGQAFEWLGKKLESSLAQAVAAVMQHIPGIGDSIAASLNKISQAAEVESQALKYYMGNAAREVGKEFAAAGKALPQNFHDNKHLLQPLYDLKDEYAEQKRLQDGILQTMQTQAGVVSTMATSTAIKYKNALFDATQQLERGNQFANSIKLSMNETGQSVASIAPAFSLAAGSGEDIELSLNNSKAHADKVQAHMLSSETAMGRVTIMGQDLAQSGALFANEIGNAKVDAKATADVFTGLSEKTKKAIDDTAKLLDEMREVFHFGRQTSKEAYENMRKGGMSIWEMTTKASQQAKKDYEFVSKMRKMEQKERLAENRFDRKMARADRLEQRGQETAAHNLRMRATAQLRETLEEIQPQIKEALEDVDEGFKSSSDAVKTGAEAGGTAVKDGGEAAQSALEDAANALKSIFPDSSDDQLALEATLAQCLVALTNIDKKLPQHALT